MTTKELRNLHWRCYKILDDIGNRTLHFQWAKEDNPNISESVLTEATAQLWADYKQLKQQIDQHE